MRTYKVVILLEKENQIHCETSRNVSNAKIYDEKKREEK